MTKAVVHCNGKKFKYNIKDINIIAPLKTTRKCYFDTAGNYIRDKDTLVVVYLMDGTHAYFQARECRVAFEEE